MSTIVSRTVLSRASRCDPRANWRRGARFSELLAGLAFAAAIAFLAAIVFGLVS